MAALVVLVAIACISLAAPLYAEHVARTDPFVSNVGGTTIIDDKRVDVLQESGGLGLGVTPIGPTWEIDRYFLGVDNQGRDVMARLLYGGRTSLLISVSAALLCCAAATVLGMLAGYFGGVVDSLLMRLTDTMLALPTFFILLAAAAVLGPSLVNTVIIISVLEWTTTARLVRGEFLVIREKEYVLAARAVGLTNLRIVRHILLNVVPVLVVAGTLAVASGILVESALSFLGLGTQPPQASWGYMLSSVQDFVFTAPLLGVFPGLLIMITVLSVNFVGEGLRDALDPRLVKR